MPKSPKKHGDAERVADISRRLMENLETAKLIQKLGQSTADANELVRGLLQATINGGLGAEMDVDGMIVSLYAGGHLL
ncbi:hypothetical protein CIP107571_02066 [Corynebacterium diphtheriae]|nr:hypothetical protein CIP107571_02066 [Corynebacterium diphtheriae]